MMSDEVSEWRRLVDRQHDIINGRANIFLIVNALLVTANAMGTAPQTALKVTVGFIMAILINLIWLALGIRAKRRSDRLWQKTRAAESANSGLSDIYTALSETNFARRFLGVTSTRVLCYFFPILFVVFWVVGFALHLVT